MSVTFGPFRIGLRTHRLGERQVEISESQLRSALAGGDPVVSREHAIGLVLSSRLSDKVPLLRGILADASAYSDLRRQAAVGLGRMNQADSRAALAEALGTADQRVLSGVVKALGWIGDQDAYARLLEQRARTQGTVLRQLEFAARLIAHRHGLPAPELPPLDLPAVLDLPPNGRLAVEVTRASAERARLCLSSIASRTFALDFDVENLYQFRCARNEWMLLFERGFSTDPAGVLVRRGIPAVSAFWMAETETFSIAWLALSEPATAGGPSRLVVCRSTGDPVLTGDLLVEGDRIGFRIRSLVRPGAFALLLEGSFRSRELTIDNALSSPIVVPKRRPSPL